MPAANRQPTIARKPEALAKLSVFRTATRFHTKAQRFPNRNTVPYQSPAFFEPQHSSIPKPRVAQRTLGCKEARYQTPTGFYSRTVTHPLRLVAYFELSPRVRSAPFEVALFEI